MNNTQLDPPPVSRTETCDRFGRRVKSGDVVHLIGKLDIMWKVVGVKPILDAKAPPGLVEISLVTRFVTAVPGGTPVMDLIKVRDAETEIPHAIHQVVAE